MSGGRYQGACYYHPVNSKINTPSTEYARRYTQRIPKTIKSKGICEENLTFDLYNYQSHTLPLIKNEDLKKTKESLKAPKMKGYKEQTGATGYYGMEDVGYNDYIITKKGLQWRSKASKGYSKLNNTSDSDSSSGDYRPWKSYTPKLRSAELPTAPLDQKRVITSTPTNNDTLHSTVSAKQGPSQDTVQQPMCAAVDQNDKSTTEDEVAKTGLTSYCESDSSIALSSNPVSPKESMKQSLILHQEDFQCNKSAFQPYFQYSSHCVDGLARSQNFGMDSAFELAVMYNRQYKPDQMDSSIYTTGQPVATGVSLEWDSFDILSSTTNSPDGGRAQQYVSDEEIQAALVLQEGEFNTLPSPSVSSLDLSLTEETLRPIPYSLVPCKISLMTLNDNHTTNLSWLQKNSNEEITTVEGHVQCTANQDMISSEGMGSSDSTSNNPDTVYSCRSGGTNCNENYSPASNTTTNTSSTSEFESELVPLMGGHLGNLHAAAPHLEQEEGGSSLAGESSRTLELSSVHFSNLTLVSTMSSLT